MTPDWRPGRAAKRDDWSRLPLAPGRKSEGEKVGIQELRRGSVEVVPDQEVAHDLARPRYLTQARTPPSSVRERQVEQLKRAVQGRVEAFLVAFPPGPDGAADVGSGIAELLRERERPPATAREASVHRHGVTSRTRDGRPNDLHARGRRLLGRPGLTGCGLQRLILSHGSSRPRGYH